MRIQRTINEANQVKYLHPNLLDSGTEDRKSKNDNHPILGYRIRKQPQPLAVEHRFLETLPTSARKRYKLLFNEHEPTLSQIRRRDYLRPNRIHKSKGRSNPWKVYEDHNKTGPNLPRDTIESSDQQSAREECFRIQMWNKHRRWIQPTTFPIQVQILIFSTQATAR